MGCEGQRTGQDLEGFVSVDWSDVRKKLIRLADREWPAEWGAKENEEIGDSYGWCHRYRLEDPISEDRIAAFEQVHGVRLWEGYKAFLSVVGNGGPGPDYGIFPLGEGEEEPLWPSVLESLSTPFQLESAWNDRSLGETSVGGTFTPDEAYYSDQVMAGAMPIATRGCALDYWLVVTGPASGSIWFDKRTDSEGVEPILDADGQLMSFETWYLAWLDEVCRKHGVD